MESKELIVRKKNYGYQLISFIFIVSVIGSILYFSNAKMIENKNISTPNGRVISYSGEKSGEIIFVNENAIKGTNKENTIFDERENQKDSIDDNINVNEIKQEEMEVENKIDNLDIHSINMQQAGTINYYASNRKLDKNKPMVALTFDDGPDPKRTIEVINLLKKYNARASFFDIGNLMEKYPETLKQEVEAGFDVGGHTYSHSNLNNLSKDEIIEEISKMEKVFRSVTGQELKYVRPTYGNANELVRKTVQHPLINWCVDSLDWKSRDTDKILEEIYQTKDFDGKIIIMHVIYDSTVKAVEKLVPDLIQKGYQLVTISEMAEYKGYTLENGKVYYQF